MACGVRLTIFPVASRPRYEPVTGAGSAKASGVPPRASRDAAGAWTAKFTRTAGVPPVRTADADAGTTATALETVGVPERRCIAPAGAIVANVDWTATV